MGERPWREYVLGHGPDQIQAQSQPRAACKEAEAQQQPDTMAEHEQSGALALVYELLHMVSEHWILIVLALAAYFILFHRPRAAVAAVDPDSDSEVKLRWPDGETSSYIKVDRLTPASRPAAAPAFCTNCGVQHGGTRFCTNCGAKTGC